MALSNEKNIIITSWEKIDVFEGIDDSKPTLEELQERYKVAFQILNKTRRDISAVHRKFADDFEAIYFSKINSRVLDSFNVLLAKLECMTNDMRRYSGYNHPGLYETALVTRNKLREDLLIDVQDLD